MAGIRCTNHKHDLWDVWSSAGVLVAKGQPLKVADAILQDVQAKEDARAAAFDEYERQERGLG